MAWTVKVTPAATRQIKKLGPTAAGRISEFLHGRLEKRDDPRELGKQLTGSELGHFWRYRVGDHRLLCEIQDAKLTVLVVFVGHRNDIYRRASR